MKRSLISVLIFVLLATLIPTATATEDFDCGEWDDVPDSRMDILTEICEYGLMQGYSESNYGYGKDIVRPELAHIANRIAMGVATYSEELDDMSWSTAYHAITDRFTDVPNPYSNEDYEWLVEAMYWGWINGLMQGDGDSYPTTYRPFDDINVVETFKVLYEAANAGDIFSDEVNNTNIAYDADPWWEELMYKLENESVILHLDVEGQSFWLGSPLTVSYSDFDSEIDREDAAIFLYYMIHKGLIDADKLVERLEEVSDSDSDYDLAVTDVYLGSTSATSDSVYVEVTNYGDESIEIEDDLNLQLFVNEDEPFQSIRSADLEEEDDDWLSPGGVSTFGPFEYEFMDDGTGVEADGPLSSIRAYIDEDDVIEESDENNNWFDLDL